MTNKRFTVIFSVAGEMILVRVMAADRPEAVEKAWNACISEDDLAEWHRKTDTMVFPGHQEEISYA